MPIFRKTTFFPPYNIFDTIIFIHLSLYAHKMTVYFVNKVYKSQAVFLLWLEDCREGIEASVCHFISPCVTTINHPIQQSAGVRVKIQQEHHCFLGQLINLCQKEKETELNWTRSQVYYMEMKWDLFHYTQEISTVNMTLCNDMKLQTDFAKWLFSLLHVKHFVNKKNSLKSDNPSSCQIVFWKYVLFFFFKHL